MKNNIIELEDGSKVEVLSAAELSKTQLANADIVCVMCKRLPPPNPMPCLSVGYQVRFEPVNGDYFLVTQAPSDSWFKACNSVGGLGAEHIYDTERVKEIYCPHRGLIWSREK